MEESYFCQVYNLAASYIERRTLEIVLEDAEYQAVRKAVLGTFGTVSN